MALPAPNPDLYAHVRVVISIITGLCITTLLSGFARFVQHPRRQLVSILHLGWAASLLLWVIHFCGGSFACRWSSSGPSRATSSSFCTQSSYYFLCTLLFPTDLRDYSGYEEYFISRRKWFFGFLAATFVADVIDTELKGAAYVHSFGIEYPIRIIANLTLCIIAMFTTNRRAQLTLLAVSFIYHITYIVLLCSTE
jgi:hypothetical protein